MNHVSRTLFIPLYGKAYVSRRGILLRDPKAEEIWAEASFPLKGKSKSKWLAYYMGMRSSVFDRWLKAQMEAEPDAAVVHLGCGLDSRVERVGTNGHRWFDVDFPDVIEQRKHYYQQTEQYQMIGADVKTSDWLEALPSGRAIVVMEGISMYLRPEELQGTLAQIAGHFENVHLLMDCYTELAAKASKVRNPINDVGVTQVFGMDDPKSVEGKGLAFVREREMTPQDLVDELQGGEKRIFKALYGGGIARKMYRLYEYRGTKR